MLGLRLLLYAVSVCASLNTTSNSTSVVTVTVTTGDPSATDFLNTTSSFLYSTPAGTADPTTADSLNATSSYSYSTPAITAASSIADPSTTETTSTCDCINSAPEIEDFVTEYVNRSLRLKWKNINETKMQCQYTYDIQINTTFRSIKNNEYTFNKIENCKNYTLDLKFYNTYTTIKKKQDLFTDFVVERSLSLDVLNESTIRVSWNLTDDCREFILHVGNSSFSVSGDFLEISNAFCENIGLGPKRNDTSPLLYYSVPGKVRNLNVSLTVNDANLVWESPVDNSCITGFVVRIADEEKLVVGNATSAQLRFLSKLEPCSEYKVLIAAKSDTNVGEFFEVAVTTMPEAIERNLTLNILDRKRIQVHWDLPDRCNDFQLHIGDKIQNVSGNVTEISDAFCSNIKVFPKYYMRDPLRSEEYSVPGVVRDICMRPFQSKMIVEWKPPFNSSCVIGYMIQINDNPLIKIENVSLQYTFVDLKPCTTYTVQIAARSKTNLGEFLTASETTLEELPPKPECNATEVGITRVRIDCAIVEETICKFNRVYIYCKTSTNFTWTKIIVSGDFNLTDIIEFTDLSPFTPYTCGARIMGYNNTNISKFSDFKFKTGEKVPSAPVNFRWTEISDNHVTLIWEAPKNITCLPKNYELTLESKPQYFIPQGCETQIGNIIRNVAFPMTSTSIQVYPSHDCVSRIKLKCDVGSGDYAELNFTSLDSVPDEPRDMTVEISNDYGKIYNVSANIRWIYPCNTKGIFSYFLVSIIEVPENGSQEFTSILYAHSNLDDIAYSYSYDNINPEKLYIVRVTSVLKNELFQSNPQEITFESPDGHPSEPILRNFEDLSNSSFSANWDPPENMNGKFQYYNISIQYLGAKHNTTWDCEFEVPVEYIYQTQNLTHEFSNTKPNHRYNVSVVASTRSGGKYAASEVHETAKRQAGAVRNIEVDVMHNDMQEDYVCEVLVTFRQPCYMNSEFKYFRVQLYFDGEKDLLQESNRMEYSFPLQPAKHYKVSVVTITEFGDGVAHEIPFQSPAGVPSVKQEPPDLNHVDEFTAEVVVNADLFDDANGEILYYAILVSGHDKIDNFSKTYGYWDGENWPENGHWTSQLEAIETYQATPSKWNPFNSYSSSVSYILGTENCTEVDTYCNGPLVPGTSYFVQIRGYTANGYRTAKAIYFETDIDRALGVGAILGIVLGVLGVLILAGGGAFYVWQKKRRLVVEESITDDSIVHIPVQTNRFPDYYAELQRNPNILKQEFLTLNTTSAELGLLTAVASIPENKTKNRYTNILPFDDTRVILRGTDCDYINASFIKGITGNVEYIATQGPLAQTVYDFWTMILDQNVSLVVMLAQFVEQKREKCYKYFPNDHEQMEIEDIQIRCSIELNYGFYCERHILVQTETKKLNVIHLQFMNWPDFGCPSGTENMLNFCLIVRKFIDEFHTKAVMHCSAGVGRTGTLIAIDILLQNIACNGDLDIFNTVMNLRRQRKNMVQTEAQYLYIHTCINDAIVNPPQLKEIKATEPIYENVKDNMIPMKVLKSDSNENIETEE